MNARLRVLYLTHHGPWPTTSGGRLRDAALIPQIARLADVEVWAVSRTPELDESSLWQAPANVPLRIFSDESERRAFPSRDSNLARRALRALLDDSETFDIVHVEGHYLYHLLPEEIHYRTVVVEHNIESHLLLQRATHRGLTTELARDIDTVSRAEERVWANARLILTLSAEDRVRILRRVPNALVYVSTDGADHTPMRAVCEGVVQPLNQPPVFGFLANYAYPPNGDALDWLVGEIFPALRRRLPNCQLVLVGANLDRALNGRDLPVGVNATGWVEDLTWFWDQIDVLLCPLRIGGGVKVKLIEAVRSGALTVSTSVGLEGLPAASREAIIQADGCKDLVEAAVKLCGDSASQRVQRARIARAQAALPTWEDVTKTLHSHWLSVARPVLGGLVGK